MAGFPCRWWAGGWCDLGCPSEILSINIANFRSSIIFIPVAQVLKFCTVHDRITAVKSTKTIGQLWNELWTNEIIARFDFKSSFWDMSYLVPNPQFQKVIGCSARPCAAPNSLSLIPLCITITISWSKIGFLVNKSTDVNGVTEFSIYLIQNTVVWHIET